MNSASREFHSNDKVVGSQVQSVLDVLPENLRAFSSFITNREGRVARFLNHKHNKKTLKLQASFDVQRQQLELKVKQLELEIDTHPQISFSKLTTKSSSKIIFEKSMDFMKEIQKVKAKSTFMPNPNTENMDFSKVTIRKEILAKRPPPESPNTPQQHKPGKRPQATPQKGKPKLPTTRKTPYTTKITLPQKLVDMEGEELTGLPLVTFNNTHFYTKDNFAIFRWVVHDIPDAQELYQRYIDWVMDRHPHLLRNHPFFNSKYFTEWLFSWQGSAFMSFLNPDDPCALHGHHTNNNCRTMLSIDPGKDCAVHGHGHTNAECPLQQRVNY